MSDRSDRTTNYLDDVDDACGCVEVWEYLSEQRERNPASNEAD